MSRSLTTAPELIVDAAASVPAEPARPTNFVIRLPAAARSDGAPSTTCVVTRVTREQRDFFRTAGGARWARRVIDECIRSAEAGGIRFGELGD